MKIYFVSILVFLSSCTTTRFLKFTEDNLNTRNQFKGGRFTYEADGSSNSSYNEGIQQAQAYCGSRKVYISNLDSKSVNYNSYVSVPQTSTFQSTVSNGSYNPVMNIEGQQTTNTIVPVQRTLTNRYVDFVCLDPDVNRKLYFLIYSANNSTTPKCVDFTQKSFIGDKRIEVLASKDDSINCINEAGWFAHYDESLRKEVFMFLDKKGLETCRKLESFLVENEILADKIEYAVKKQLKCGK